jgi:dTDP-glucose pyrophosphorylase
MIDNTTNNGAHLDWISVLIPAAGRVPDSIKLLSNIDCSAMIPVAGRPLIYWTLTYLKSIGLKHFIIGVPRKNMFIEDFVHYTFGRDCDISYIVPTSDEGLGMTVDELSAAATGRSSLVVLGDTHFQFSDIDTLRSKESFILVSSVEESYRWCTADINERGYVTALHDKEPNLSGPLDALIGVYYFPDTFQLKHFARQAVTQARIENRSVTMADILQPLAKKTPIRAYRASEWLDCGNPDRIASTHRTLLQKREFNELSVDQVIGTITKRSRKVEKFVDEINFLRLMPKELSVLFPRIIDYSTDWNNSFLKMEYYGYPSLSEIFVFEDVHPGIWVNIFNHLYDIITKWLMQLERPLSSNALYDMYILKTKKRLESMEAPPELLNLVRTYSPITINGKKVANLTQIWDRIEANVALMSHGALGHIIHGDLCFSNILYDLRERICKLIDPRGSFGSAGIYGDTRYDIAKLYHSVHGMYDFIINDLFYISVRGVEVQFDIYQRPSHREIDKQFEKVFFPYFSRNEILLLTGLLFASMPALHYDKPMRQIAMYVRSLQMFNEVFGDDLKMDLK